MFKSFRCTQLTLPSYDSSATSTCTATSNLVTDSLRNAPSFNITLHFFVFDLKKKKKVRRSVFKMFWGIQCTTHLGLGANAYLNMPKQVYADLTQQKVMPGRIGLGVCWPEAGM